MKQCCVVLLSCSVLTLCQASGQMLKPTGPAPMPEAASFANAQPTDKRVTLGNASTILDWPLEVSCWR